MTLAAELRSVGRIRACLKPPKTARTELRPRRPVTNRSARSAPASLARRSGSIARCPPLASRATFASNSFQTHSPSLAAASPKESHCFGKLRASRRGCAIPKTQNLERTSVKLRHRLSRDVQLFAVCCGSSRYLTNQGVTSTSERMRLGTLRKPCPSSGNRIVISPPHCYPFIRQLFLVRHALAAQPRFVDWTVPSP